MEHRREQLVDSLSQMHELPSQISHFGPQFHTLQLIRFAHLALLVIVPVHISSRRFISHLHSPTHSPANTHTVIAANAPIDMGSIAG